MAKTWRYGDPAPKTWREAADVIKAFDKPAPKPKSEKDAK